MEFDLTTSEGRKQALEHFDRYGWLYAPDLWIIKKVWEGVSSSDTIHEQQKTAMELIKAGRDNNVDEMKITLDQTAGIDIGGDVEGIPVKAAIGKHGKMTLEVKYKDS